MKNENLILKIYSITVTLILAFVFLTGLKSNILNQKFEEITVQRINIVEPDGQLKMVISNQARQHPGMIDGKVFQKRERAPGILFFNEEQDEVGALGYHGSDKNGDNRYGLQLWERDKELTQPERIHIFDSLDKAGFNYPQKLEYLKAIHGGQPVSAPRMFVGRYYDSKTGLFIQDKYGTDRLRFYVDSDNSPKIELLDEKGRIIKDILID
jgi:hypothetical protein